MKCTKVKPLISEYGLGQVSPLEKKAIDEHLRDCPDCARLAAQDAKLESLFSLIEEKDPPRPLWPAVYTQLQHERLTGGYKLPQGRHGVRSLRRRWSLW